MPKTEITSMEQFEAVVKEIMSQCEPLLEGHNVAVVAAVSSLIFEGAVMSLRGYPEQINLAGKAMIADIDQSITQALNTPPDAAAPEAANEASA